jgi:hypothetical protein
MNKIGQWVTILTLSKGTELAQGTRVIQIHIAPEGSHKPDPAALGQLAEDVFTETENLRKRGAGEGSL